MKENSIEEDIKNAEHFIKSIKTDKEYKEENGWHGYYNKEIVDLARILEHILSDYKRVLKENEELKNFRKNFVDVTDKELKEANDYFSRKYTFMGDELAQHINTLLKVTSNSISVQKLKDKIEELNKNILNAERFDEIILKYRYQKQALQELLEGEELGWKK